MIDVPDGREFPAGAADAPDGLSRRRFAQLLGAGLALAGAACVREPSDEILPYVADPGDGPPDRPLHYATSMVLDGYATGLLVESHTGRPTKIEGNPEHPASLGAAGVFEQASILGLYDPHRETRPLRMLAPASWAELDRDLSPASIAQKTGARGDGLCIVLEPTSSPLLIELLGRVRTRFPDAQVYFPAALASATPLEAARRALGAPLLPQHDFTQADVVVTLDADVMASGPFALRYAHDIAQRRRAGRASGNPMRLYVAEPCPSPTGTLADRRLATPSSTLGTIASALLHAVSPTETDAPPTPAATAAWVRAVAADLAAHRGRAVVVAGERQHVEVHVLVQALNAAIGAVGRTVWYTASPILEAGGPSHEVHRMATELASARYGTLLALDTSLMNVLPADRFRLPHPLTLDGVYLGASLGGTAAYTTWYAPAAHYLESWGDARAYDGTVSLIQPLIAPLHGGRTPAEMLARLAGDPSPDIYALLRQTWSARLPNMWDDVLRRGIVPDSALPRTTPTIRPAAVAAADAAVRAAAHRDTIEVAFVPSAAVYDGRFSNNAWLQELPDPITKQTWGNAARLSPALAARLGVATGDVVALGWGQWAADIPVILVAGHADGAITIPLGYPDVHLNPERGADDDATHPVASPFVAMDVKVTRTERHESLAITQSHWSLEGRGTSILGPTRHETPNAKPTPRRRPLTLYEPTPPSSRGFGEDQWAMTIDLDACTGCGACIVACQAENNIPVVGIEGVLAGREMHWMRVDRYVDAQPDDPGHAAVQPMLCQHCEKAPCEYVCPVDATVHSDDGLNEMVYNRCVGTRFCSNNCPYKVRRFNWFEYNGAVSETERMGKNPDVTVRARGVMEKCTFCVQRVRRAQRDAELAGEPHTGPVTTACQQTCPTQAIVFGSLTDPNAEVTRLSADPRAFSALDELGTVPRVRYLARVPNGDVPRSAE